MPCRTMPPVLAARMLAKNHLGLIAIGAMSLAHVFGCATHVTFRKHGRAAGAAGMGDPAGGGNSASEAGGNRGGSNSSGTGHTQAGGAALAANGGAGDTQNGGGGDESSDAGDAGDAGGKTQAGRGEETTGGVGGRAMNTGGADAHGGTESAGGASGRGIAGGAGNSSTCSGSNACTPGRMECADHGVKSCQTGSDGCAAWQVVSTCSAPLVCERQTGPTCADGNWAEWPMPNSPSETAAPNLESYTDNGDGTVTDNVTKLMWEQAASTSTYSWTDAMIYCSSRTTAGNGDWRVPSMIELASLLDLGRSSPAINTIYFPSTPPTRFWSSSGNAGIYAGWFVDFSGGPLQADEADFTTVLYNVRCVR